MIYSKNKPFPIRQLIWPNLVKKLTKLRITSKKKEIHEAHQRQILQKLKAIIGVRKKTILEKIHYLHFNTLPMTISCVGKGFCEGWFDALSCKTTPVLNHPFLRMSPS